MREIALFSRQIYTPETNFTRPPVVTVATNLNSASLSSLISAIIIIISLSLSELGVSSRCHFLSQVLYFVGFLAWSLKNTQRKNILHIFVHQHQIYVLYLSPPSVSQLDKWANQPLHLKSCPRLPGSTLFGPEIRTWEHLTHDDTCGGDYDDYCLKQKIY